MTLQEYLSTIKPVAFTPGVMVCDVTGDIEAFWKDEQCYTDTKPSAQGFELVRSIETEEVIGVRIFNPTHHGPN